MKEWNSNIFYKYEMNIKSLNFVACCCETVKI